MKWRLLMVTQPDEVLTAGAHLEELAGRLGNAGLYARCTQPIGRPPGLHVLNPDTPGLEEHVTLERCGDGDWWLWAWSERIAPADDMEHAVASIRRVLGQSTN
jgi:hypothetical protein